MIRSDLLDQVNQIMQEVLKNTNPFGGKNLVFFGDLAQLEPVVTEKDKELIDIMYPSHFFFDSPAFQEIKLKVLKLTTIFRQQGDLEFINALQSIRKGNTDHLALFNKKISKPSDNSIRITYTNNRCNSINDAKLKEIDSQQYLSTAVISGDFEKSDFPANEEVKFKLGARVMLLINNRDPNNEYVNGDIGTIRHIAPGKITVELDRTRSYVNVEKYTWEKTAYVGDSDHVGHIVVGTFTQVPMKLAWSLTVHKVQGQTFHDQVHVELDTRTFAHGLLYVALSRATKLENLTIGRMILPGDIIIADRVNDWCADNGV